MRRSTEEQKERFRQLALEPPTRLVASGWSMEGVRCYDGRTFDALERSRSPPIIALLSGGLDEHAASAWSDLVHENLGVNRVGLTRIDLRHPDNSRLRQFAGTQLQAAIVVVRSDIYGPFLISNVAARYSPLHGEQFASCGDVPVRRAFANANENGTFEVPKMGRLKCPRRTIGRQDTLKRHDFNEIPIGTQNRRQCDVVKIVTQVILESAEFWVTSWRPVTFARSRQATAQ